ncbi:MAG: hypothetical protein ABL994_00835 [Verrucomicrobiales bacterium]
MDLPSQLDLWLWDADVPLAWLLDGSCFEEIVVPYLRNHHRKNRGIVFAPEPEREMSFAVAEALAALRGDDQLYNQLLDRPVQEWPLIWRENLGAGKGNGSLHHVLMVESVEIMAERPLEERLEFMSLLFALAAEPGLSVALVIDHGAVGRFEGIPEMEKLDFSSACPVQPMALVDSLELIVDSHGKQRALVPAVEKTQEEPLRKLSSALLVAAVLAVIGVAISINFSVQKAVQREIGSTAARSATPHQPILAVVKTVPLIGTEDAGFTWPQPEAAPEPTPELRLPAEEWNSQRRRKTASFPPIEVALFSRNLEIHFPKIVSTIELSALEMAGNSAGLDLALIDNPSELGVWKMPDRPPAPPVETAMIESRRIPLIGVPALKLSTDFLEKARLALPEIHLQLLALPVSLAPETLTSLDADFDLSAEGLVGEFGSLFPGKLPLGEPGKTASVSPKPVQPDKKTVSAVLKRFKTLENHSPEGLRQAYATLTTADPDHSSPEMEEWLNQITTRPQTFDREVALAFQQIGDLESASGRGAATTPKPFSKLARPNSWAWEPSAMSVWRYPTCSAPGNSGTGTAVISTQWPNFSVGAFRGTRQVPLRHSRKPANSAAAAPTGKWPACMNWVSGSPVISTQPGNSTAKVPKTPIPTVSSASRK